MKWSIETDDNDVHFVAHRGYSNMYPDNSLEAIEALAKYRGANMHRKACEAFMLIREVIN